MVNSYKCYCEYTKGIGEKPMSHYEYQKMIAHAWMDKGYYSKKSEEDGIVSTVSTFSISTCTSRGGSRSRISVSGLNPITGSLKCRLDKSLPHWPLAIAKQDTKLFNCQLHYWATGKRIYQNVQYCKECNISLCTDKCYEIFHTCWDLASQKDKIRAEIEGDKND